MQISLKWINELVNIQTVCLEDLIEKLTLGGFEIEEVLELEIKNEKTLALEVSTTANRSDSLSIQGISAEIAALLNKKPKTYSYTNPTLQWNQTLQQSAQMNFLPNNCSEFIGLTVENLENSTSPKWLKQKLLASGITPENNLQDFQNYILLETGYPIEFYDFDQISQDLKTKNFDLNLTFASSNEHFLAANQVTYTLDKSVLMLSANEIPISIAGMIAQQTYAYSKNTKSLLIEGSIFNASMIRQQSRTLGLRTNRSARYEKSISNTNLLGALSRLVYLLKLLNPNLICKLHTNTQSLKQEPKIIKLNYKTINTILGPTNERHLKKSNYISKQVITELLDRLQFKSVYDDQDNTWLVTVPDFRRNDIEREIDLIEEIGRLYGFNNFFTRLPSFKQIGTEDLAYRLRKKVTSCLINLGLTELIQYSLVPEETYLTNEIKLINPLVKEYSNLRSSLLPNLIKAIEENQKKSNVILEGFEYGHIFASETNQTFQEQESIAGILGGTNLKSDWSDSVQVLKWFEAKAKLDQLCQNLNILTYWQFYKPMKEKTILHPYRTAELYLSDHSKLGIFGQIHPLLAKKLNIPAETYLFELNFELMKKEIKKNKVTLYREYSLYPKIIKDLSFIVSNTISFEELKAALYINGSKFLTEINLLDEYKGASIPINHSSLCIQFVFQSDNQTLKNKKIEMILDHLKLLLVKKFNAQLRT